MTQITQRNWVFTKIFDFLIFISLQPDSINLWYCKLWLFDISNYEFCQIKSLSWHIKGFTLSGCKDIWIRKYELVAKTWFSFLDTRQWWNSLLTCTKYSILELGAGRTRYRVLQKALNPVHISGSLAINPLHLRSSTPTSRNLTITHCILHRKKSCIWCDILGSQ